MTNSVEF